MMRIRHYCVPDAYSPLMRIRPRNNFAALLKFAALRCIYAALHLRYAALHYAA